MLSVGNLVEIEHGPSAVGQIIILNRMVAICNKKITIPRFYGT